LDLATLSISNDFPISPVPNRSVLAHGIDRERRGSSGGSSGGGSSGGGGGGGSGW
jgi:hypothetical protein